MRTGTFVVQLTLHIFLLKYPIFSLNFDLGEKKTICNLASITKITYPGTLTVCHTKL